MAVGNLQGFLESRGLAMPSSFGLVYNSDLPKELGDLLLNPHPGHAGSMGAVEEQINAGPWPLLPNLVPFMRIDEASFACVVVSDLPVDGESNTLPGEGAVVRWHLKVHEDALQAALLDVDCYLYAESVADEMRHRDAGLRRMLDEIGPAYAESHIQTEKRPRDYVLRPFRIACQNVIVGLAAIAQDSSFDGLAVAAWQACEVPHIAAHEANRALTALTLCDAFQNGGTMEIRFDRETRIQKAGKTKKYPGHPEGAVPASLRRYARTVGVSVGVDHPAAISPAEARELFLAITPMPPSLRQRVNSASEEMGISPERLCFALLMPVWRDIELDFMLATSNRTRSILSGGAEWTDRFARQAESEVCRAAVMLGMLYRRLNATDAAGPDNEARVVEDRKVGVTWEVLPEAGAVRFSSLDAGTETPWTVGVRPRLEETLTVFSRSHVTPDVISAAQDAEGHAAIVVPSDTPAPTLPPGVHYLRCPDRLPDIDKAIEAKLLTSRISRG